MKKKKDQLSHKQFHMLRIAHKDTYQADKWLHDIGLNANTFPDTHIKLLQAKRQAHAIINHHLDLLTHEQRTTIEHFQQLMRGKKTPKHLKPNAANSVLNIASKINRKIFKQHRQTQATTGTT
jgi:hypothetical protein